MSRFAFDCLFYAACVGGIVCCAVSMPPDDGTALLGTATAAMLADKLLGVVLSLPAVIVFAITKLRGGEGDACQR